MKVRCKKQFKRLAGIIDKGDELEIESILSEEDKQLHSGYIPNWAPTGKVFIKISEPLIQPKGTYIGYRFKAKDGHTYDDSSIKNAIGYANLSDIFEKI